MPAAAAAATMKQGKHQSHRGSGMASSWPCFLFATATLAVLLVALLLPAARCMLRYCCSLNAHCYAFPFTAALLQALLPGTVVIALVAVDVLLHYAAAAVAAGALQR